MARVGGCRLCGSGKTTRHHVIPIRLIRTFGFTHAEVRHDDNIIPLCREHHDAVERGIYLSMIRETLTQRELGYIIQTAGRDWLDHHYPETSSWRLQTPHRVTTP